MAAAISLDHESDDYWAIVSELQRRGDRDTFEVSVSLSDSPDAAARAVALDVLAQLGFAEGRPFLEESLPLALSAARDGDSLVKIAAISALGHLGDPRALSALIEHLADPDEDVRLAVAVALPAVAGEPPAEVAVEALILLTRDSGADVRDWATFGLGSQIETDTPAVRGALAERLDDPDGDISGEALVGLARRHDARATERLLQWLQVSRLRKLGG